MNRLLHHLFHQYRFLYLLLFILLVLGIKAMLEMPSSIYPPLSFPRIVVVAEVGDKAPDQMTIMVTGPLENALSTVPNIKRIRSKTIRGSSEISVEFLDNTDMDKALTQVQGRIAEASKDLPADAALTVERLTPGAFPVMVFNVSSHALPLTDVQEIVRYEIAPALQRAPGVSRVLYSGGDIREIRIELDPILLRQASLMPTQVVDVLQKTSRVTAVGKAQANHQQTLIVENSEAKSVADFENILIPQQKGLPIPLSAVARIYEGIQERTSLVSGSQGPCVSISILKQPDANMITVSHDVRSLLSDLKARLPQGIAITPVYDQASLVHNAVSNVKEAIIIGSLLIVLILFVFLRDWRTTLLSALTIPLTVLLTFWVMSLMNQDFNLMSLGGLAVAIGLVIDDAIVIIENIHRHRQAQPDVPLRAIIQHAVSELGSPIISSTLTTIVVFLPLGFLSGLAGQFFQALGFTLSTSVLISLGIAVVVLPLLALQFLRPAPPSHEGVSYHEGKLDRGYSRFLATILTNPKPQLILITVLIVAGSFLAFILPTGFMPDMDEGSYVIDYFTPPGSSLQASDAIARQVESILARTPEVESWSRRTGAELGFFATESSKGDILVHLKDPSQRHRSVFAIMEEQRHTFETLMPRVNFDFMQILQDQLDDLAGAPAPIEVKIFGSSSGTLETIAHQVEKAFMHISGLVDIKLGTQLNAKQIDILPLPTQLAPLGLTPDDLLTQLQTALLGTVVTQLRQNDRFIPVRVRYPLVYRQAVEDIMIFTPANTVIPLNAVAQVVYRLGPGEIQRENQQRFVSVEGAPENRDLGSIQNDILKYIRTLKVPTGYHVEIGGLFQSQQQAFQQLLLVLGLSGLLVYAIMVFQFRSFTRPLLILAMIPLGMAGVVLVLWLTRTPLNVASFMGIILLTGLIVKNGIILITYTDQLYEQEGLELREAVEKASRTRLRPILMTTLATMLGLLPLAIGWGSGAELQKPLAIAVIGGLFFSTYMSLTVLPWLYLRLKTELPRKQAV